MNCGEAKRLMQMALAGDASAGEPADEAEESR